MSNITDFQKYKKQKAIEDLTVSFDKIRELHGNVNLLVAVAYVNIKEHGSFEMNEHVLTEEFLRDVLFRNDYSLFEIPLNDEFILRALELYMATVPTDFESITIIEDEPDSDV